jgi:hypothetical protein
LPAVIAVISFAFIFSCASQPSGRPTPEQISDYLYKDWNAVLSAVVTHDGYVRWDRLQNDKDLTAKLQQFVGLIGQISPDDRPDLFATAADREAFWINAHNALAMFAVVQHGYPDLVPLDVAGGDVFPGDSFVVGGEHLTLSQIVQSKLAPFADARALAALNQCCVSSPPLRDQAYVGSKLDAQLTDQQEFTVDPPGGMKHIGDAAFDARLDRPRGP